MGDVIISLYFISLLSNFSLFFSMQQSMYTSFHFRQKDWGVKFFVLNFSFLLTNRDTLGKWLIS